MYLKVAGLVPAVYFKASGDVNMKIAYFDCFAGASGDMILGSLMDTGLELEQLKAELAKLHLTHYDLQMMKVVKKGVGGCQVPMMLVMAFIHHHHSRVKCLVTYHRSNGSDHNACGHDENMAVVSAELFSHHFGQPIKWGGKRQNNWIRSG